MSPALTANNKLNNIRKGGMRVLVVAGASGGHIFPALGFLDTLKDKYKNIEIRLVLPKKRTVNEQIENFIQISYISISSVKVSLDFDNLVAIWGFLKGILESVFIILRFRPTVVVGFGSSACIPIILLAWVFGIKTLIHEQNVIAGRANRLLAKFADRVAISFTKTQDYFKDYQGKLVLTGNPLRKELKRYAQYTALEYFGFNNEKFTILVMGGSRGSHSINIGFLKAISKISGADKLQIIHLCGTGDCELLNTSYTDLNVRVKLFSFLEPMQYAYSAADLVLARAGATTIAEIIFFGLPAIIIPYPYAYRHQMANAGVLENIGSSIIIEDNKLNTDTLRDAIEELIKNPERLKSMRAAYADMPQINANELLVEEVLSLNK